jgi:hypothetical protein
LRNGGSICDATKAEVVEQLPYAMDIVSARHPLMVGLVRSWLNGNGDFDRVAKDYVRSSMEHDNPGAVDCYIGYYTVMFDKDGVRQAEADWIEHQLNLN